MKLLLFTAVVLLAGCVKPCQDLWGLEKSTMVIYPFDLATNQYLYSDNPSSSLFNRDSLKVFNENGRQFEFVSFGLESDPRNPVKGFYAINISPAFIVPDDNDAFHHEKARNIYLQYSATQVDTLRLVFKAGRTKCDRSQYEYLNIFFRNKLIASVQRDNGIDFTLKR